MATVPGPSVPTRPNASSRATYQHSRQHHCTPRSRPPQRPDRSRPRFSSKPTPLTTNQERGASAIPQRKAPTGTTQRCVVERRARAEHADRVGTGAGPEAGYRIRTPLGNVPSISSSPPPSRRPPTSDQGCGRTAPSDRSPRP